MHVACKVALAVAVALGVASQARAQNLSPPPSGLLILDLAGTPIYHGLYAVPGNIHGDDLGVDGNVRVPPRSRLLRVR